MKSPDPNTLYPLPDYKNLIFLKNVIQSELIEVGDFTYLEEPQGPENFEHNNVLYHFDFVGDKLIIGKFCSIAREVKFIMNGANHSLSGISTYPFHIFGHDWEKHIPPDGEHVSKGDTQIGNDVWIGYRSVILPGITIGDGAVVGACSLVTADVEPYTIVGGNPAKKIRKRFNEQEIFKLLEIKWWDWNIDIINENLDTIASGDLNQLWEIYQNLNG